LHEAGSQAIIYPWEAWVQEEEDLMIKTPTDIPMALPILKIFINKHFL